MTAEETSSGFPCLRRYLFLETARFAYSVRYLLSVCAADRDESTQKRDTASLSVLETFRVLQVRATSP